MFTFTKSNMSNQPITVTVDPTDFTVKASGGGPIWQSSPANGSLAGAAVILQPGQSVTQTAIWDGTQGSAGRARACGDRMWSPTRTRRRCPRHS